MDHHHPHPPPPPPPPPFHPINHTTTTQIVHHSLKIISSHITTFLLLSLLILTFHSNVRHAADYLSSFLDHNSSLKSLITRIELSHQSTQPHPHHLPLHHPHRRRRRPFLHLTRVGTLDDDFFSSDSDFDRSLFNPVSKPDPNSTFLIFSNLGFETHKSILRKGFSFKYPLENYQFTPHPGDLDNVRSNNGGRGSKNDDFMPYPGDLDNVGSNNGSSDDFTRYPGDLEKSRSNNGSSDDFTRYPGDLEKSRSNNGSSDVDVENDEFTPRLGDVGDGRAGNGRRDGDVENDEFTPHLGDHDRTGNGRNDGDVENYENTGHLGDIDNGRSGSGRSDGDVENYEYDLYTSHLGGLDNGRSGNGRRDGGVENYEYMPRSGDLIDNGRSGSGGSDGDVENYRYTPRPGDVDDSSNGGSDGDVENYGYRRYRADVDNSKSKNGGGSDEDMVDLRFLIGLRLNRGDALSFFHLIAFLTLIYGYMIVCFLMIYTWIYGVVFLQVVEDVLGRYRSVFRTLWDGSGLGIKRLIGFVLMRWAVRDALSQVVGIYFFGEVEDQFTIFRVLVRMKLMPFSDVSMLIKGHEMESLGFILTWFFVELVVGFIFAVDSWVAIVDSRKSGKEIMKEGCRMLATMLLPSIEIKCWESMACGVFTRWMLQAAGGDAFALFFQSFMEVYFLVVWLVFYLAAKEKEAVLMGRTFGQQEVEGFLEGIR